MKLSEQWLREWVNCTLPQQELLEKLTMAGHEVGSVEPVASEFEHLVVGEVLSLSPHPKADRLQICEVNVGQAGESPITIVCGATNVAVGMRVPVALPGAVLSETLTIKPSKLRGVESFGMLCSAKELGMAESSEGLMALPEDAPIGKSIRNYLKLDDHSIDLELTPNRGDCLGMEGLAREVAAITHSQFQQVEIKPQQEASDRQLEVALSAPEACPRYMGRVIENVNVSAATPLWMQERLRRAGLRSIDAIVDVTNYVMLELGQPMHAFDCNNISGHIDVRWAHANEKLTLLDGQSITLNEKTLVIADEKQVLAIAGVMGGEYSGVSRQTQAIFLESAFFVPEQVAGRARMYGLHTDSSHRFERGVAPSLAARAIERATELIVAISGGQAGPVTCAEALNHLPQAKSINLRHQRIERVLGVSIPANDISHMLQRLGKSLKVIEGGWQVLVPVHRFDIHQEVDLIEEVGRLYGYDNIPATPPVASLNCLPTSEKTLSLRQFRQVLVGRDYHEIISYSFVDAPLNQQLNPSAEAIALSNPLSQEFAEMRTCLWPGLIKAIRHNQHRQQSRLRFFETGLKFYREQGDIKQITCLAGAVTGELFPEQWGVAQQTVDFFDVKGDLDALFALTGASDCFEYRALAPSDPAAKVLHPGQSAQIWRNNSLVGTLGVLPSQFCQKLDVKGPVILFELSLQVIEAANIPKFATLSKYPAIRRDLALLVNNATQAAELCHAVREAAGEWLVDVQIFDVYQDETQHPGKKSLALSLLLQHQTRTFIDEEVNEIIAKVLSALSAKCQAVLRE